MINIQKTNHDLAASFKKEFSRKLVKFGAVKTAAVIVVIALILFINYQVKDIRSARADRQWLVKSLNVIVELNNNQTKADEIISRFEKMLPTSVEVPTKAIPRLKNAAQTNGLKADIKLGAFRQQENEEPAGIDFSLRVDGNFQGIIDFLSGMEKDNLIKAFQWDLLPISGANYQLSFTGKIYVRQ